MPQWDDLFDHRLAFDPDADLESSLRQFPAAGAVYLLSDAEDRPVQLICVKNLRYSLRRRLGRREDQPRGKRVDYRALVRNVRWRRIDGDFEADWIYLLAARQIFPNDYREMIGYHATWWVHVDPSASFPRYARVADPRGKLGVVLGPLEQKQCAAQLIELIEDLFDLCRYYNRGF